MALESKQGSEELAVSLKKYTSQYNSGSIIVDNAKNKFANYLIEKYGNDIYTLSVYGLLNAAGKGAHININESFSYNDFSAAMDYLLTVDHQNIEKNNIRSIR